MVFYASKDGRVEYCFLKDFFFVEDEKDRLVSRLLKNGNENILLWKMERSIAILFYFFFKKTKKGLSNENRIVISLLKERKDRSISFFFIREVAKNRSFK